MTTAAALIGAVGYVAGHKPYGIRTQRFGCNYPYMGPTINKNKNIFLLYVGESIT